MSDIRLKFYLFNCEFVKLVYWPKIEVVSVQLCEFVKLDDWPKLEVVLVNLCEFVELSEWCTVEVTPVWVGEYVKLNDLETEVARVQLLWVNFWSGVKFKLQQFVEWIS